MRNFALAVRRVSDACAVLAALLLAGGVLIICYMIARRALGYSSYWEVEASIYFTVAATFLASPYTLRTGGHVAVELIPDRLPGRARMVMLQALKAVGLLVCVYLAWEGFRLAHEAFVADERSISMWRPPRWPMYAMLPVGMALTALEYLCELFVAHDVEALSPETKILESI